MDVHYSIPKFRSQVERIYYVILNSVPVPIFTYAFRTLWNNPPNYLDMPIKWNVDIDV